MKIRVLANVVLWGLILIGLYGAVSVSWQTYTQVSPCPQMLGVYICYVVLASYSLIALALLMGKSSLQKTLFYSAWIIVFGFALFGSVLEMGNGNTCPKSSSGFPMCYASLMLSTSIGLLFWYSTRLSPIKKAENSPE